MGNVTAFTKYNGNPIACCFKGVSMLLLLSNPRIKLISCEGSTKVLKGRTKIKAGEIMFEFPDCVVCHADSFILGRPIPVLAIHDHLMAGHTYFIIPLDRLPRSGQPLSATSLQYLSSPLNSGNNNSNSNSNSNSNTGSSPIISCTTTTNNNNNTNLFISSGADSKGDYKGPFEYIKDKDGRVLMIKVVPEFITRIISANNNDNSPSNNNNLICTTPELQKQYEQLVRAKDQGWSPKLETISENKIRSSPSKFLMKLEWIPIKLSPSKIN